jgi:hypothetical protein
MPRTSASKASISKNNSPLIYINEPVGRCGLSHGWKEPCWAGGTLPVEDARELRRLAEWYRAFAELAGNAETRRDRLKMAEYLERKADELERRAADDPQRKPP